MRNKGHVFGVRTFTDSKNTLLGTCPETQGTLNRCLLEKKRVSEHLRCRIFRINTDISRMRLLNKEQVYRFFFLGGGGGRRGDYFAPEQVY